MTPPCSSSTPSPKPAATNPIACSSPWATPTTETRSAISPTSAAATARGDHFLILADPEHPVHGLVLCSQAWIGIAQPADATSVWLLLDSEHLMVHSQQRIPDDLREEHHLDS